MRPTIPAKGQTHASVLTELAQFRQGDTDWRGGKVFSLVYHAGQEHEEFLAKAHALYAATNGLNPIAFQSLRRIESEVVAMVASLFHAPTSAVGAMTSGGTESILVAMQTYRDRARRQRRMILDPEIVLPVTAHPAFDKAAHYFGLKLRKIPVDADYRVDVKAMARAITRRTISLVASAPQYPHGVIDPIEAVGALADKHGLPLHVDACVGGFILPWLETIGRRVPRWDFRVAGVTSISADLHKYGYAGKGASTLLWRSMAEMRDQFTVFTDWPGGIYVSPSVAGTRPGGPIAAAWATLRAVGADGYVSFAKSAIEAADRLRAGIAKIPELVVIGDSQATIVAWGAREGGPDVYAIADRLEARGWTVDRQQRPPSVHLTVTQNHAPIVDEYLADLQRAVDEVRDEPALRRRGTAPMYGMIAKIPLRGLVANNVRKVMEQMYAPDGAAADLTNAPRGDGIVDKIVEKYGQGATDLIDKVQVARERLRRRLRR